MRPEQEESEVYTFEGAVCGIGTGHRGGFDVTGAQAVE